MDSVAHVRLTSDLVQRLDDLSQAELRSRSNMIIRLLDEGLRRREMAAERTDEDG